MRGLLASFLIALTCSIAEGQLNIWNGIQPLRSTRANVEAKYGKPAKDDRWSARYVSNGKDIDVVYSQKPCDKGWDVPTNTVLRLEVSGADNAGKSFKELGLNKDELFVSVDDAFFALWTQPENGRTYYFENVDQRLHHEGYIPTRSDNTRRCEGFPPFVSEAINYMALDQFSWTPLRGSDGHSFYDVLGRIDAFLADGESRSESNYKGYLVIYFDNKLPLATYKKRLAEIEKHIFVFRKQSRENVSVIEAGYCEEPRVELYLLPRDWKPPAPDPTLPSPQFTKKGPVKN